MTFSEEKITTGHNFRTSTGDSNYFKDAPFLDHNIILNVISKTTLKRPRTHLLQTRLSQNLPDSSQQHFSWWRMYWLLGCKKYSPSACCTATVLMGWKAVLDALRRYGELKLVSVRPTARLGKKGGSWKKVKPNMKSWTAHFFTQQSGWRWRMSVRGDREGWHLK